MKVKFVAFGRVDPFDKAEFELAEGTTLGALLEMLVLRYGPDWLAGTLSVNSEIVYQEKVGGVVLHDGDTILLSPPLSGG